MKLGAGLNSNKDICGMIVTNTECIYTMELRTKFARKWNNLDFTIVMGSIISECYNEEYIL